MKTIYKYPLEITDQQQVSMPVGAEILCVQVQNGKPCLWAQVNDALPQEVRSILQFGTGSEITGLDNKYIGTYQIHGAGLVFHVFEAMI